MTDQADALPPLPEPYDGLVPNGDDLGKGILDGFTAEQLRAYARLARSEATAPLLARIAELEAALRKIADWGGSWGPWPETKSEWGAMAIVTAREAVTQERDTAIAFPQPTKDQP